MAWENGELITATKLNSMENGIGENNMSYEKHTWETGELITAEKLNHMEEGIESGGELHNPKLTINVTAQSNIPIVEQLGLLNGNIVTGTDAYLYLKNNEFMSYPYDELPEDGVVYFSDEERTKTVTCYVANYNGDYLWSLGDTILFNFQNATFSNMVNCSESNYTVIITDPSKGASFDLLVELFDD